MRPRAPRSRSRAAGLVRGLAEQAAVEGDVGVDAEHDRALARAGELEPGARLAPGVLEHDLARVALAELVDRGDDPRTRPRGARGSRAGAGDAEARIRRALRQPNQIPISRSADSSESEPWTRLKVTSRP